MSKKAAPQSAKSDLSKVQLNANDQLTLNDTAAKAGVQVHHRGKSNTVDLLDPKEQLNQEDLAILDEEVSDGVASRVILAQADGAVSDAPPVDAGSVPPGSAAAPAGETAGSGASGAAEAGEVGAGLLMAAVVGVVGIAAASSGGSSSPAPTPVPDTTAPIAPTLALAVDTGASAVDGITRNGQVNVTGLEAGATWEYSTDAGVSWTAGTGTSVTLTGDGAKSVIVRQTDAVGNTSANSAALVFTIDTTTAAAPTVPDLVAASDTGLSNIDNITAAATPVFSGTGAEAGATVTLLEGATVLGTATADGAGAWSITSSTLAVGVHNISASQTDAAGNTSAASAALAVTIVAPPAAPGLALAQDGGFSATDGITLAGMVIVTGVGAGATWEYSTNGGALWSAAQPAATTIFTLTQGTYAIGAVQVRQTDVAGNTSTTGSNAAAITVDTTAPVEPGLALATDSGVSAADGITNVGTVNVTGVEPGAVWSYSTNGGISLAPGTGSSFTLTPGTYAIGAVQVVQRDVAGNVTVLPSGNAAAITVDMGAPTATVATVAFSADTGVSATDFITATAAQDLSGTYTGFIGAGETLEISLNNGATWIAATTAAGGNWTLTGQTLTASNTLQARVTDTAGNSSTPLIQPYVLDTTAPTATVATVVFSADTGVSATDFITFNPSQNLSGTYTGAIGAGETLEISLDNGATWTAATTAAGGNWTLTGQTLTASNTLQARVTDTAGNSSTALIQPYVLDTVAPTTTSTIDTVWDDYGVNTGLVGNGGTTDDTSPALYGTPSAALAADEVVAVYDGATRLGLATIGGLRTSWTYPDTTQANGNTANYTVRVEDAAGNASAASAVFNVTISAPTATAAIILVQDNVAPIIAPLTSGGVTNDTSLDLSGTITGALGADVVAVYDGVTRLGPAIVGGGGTTWTYADTRVLANGSAVSYTVVVENGAGDQGLMSTAFTTTIDTALPATPTLALAADTGVAADGITSNGIVNVTGLEAGGTWEYSTNGGGVWTAGTGTSFTLAGDGAKSVIVRQTDGAGNVSANSAALAFTLDTTALAPSVPDLIAVSDSGSSAIDNITNVATPVFSGTAEAGATVTLLDGATVLGTTVADGLGNWSITSSPIWPSPAFPNTQGAVYNISATQTDLAGNVSAASAPLAVTIDPWSPSVLDGAFVTTGATTFDMQFTESVGAAGTAGLTATKNGVVTPLPIGAVATPLTVAIPNDGFTFNIAPDTLAASDYVVLNYDATLGSVTDVAGNPLGSGTIVFGSQGTLGAAGTTIDLTANPIPAPYGSVFIRTHQGNDTVTGTSGFDYIKTGRGADVVNGSWGQDIIDLAEGAPYMDTVVLMQGMSSVMLPDVIQGFDVSGAGAAAANNDRLDLRSNNIAAATGGFVDGVNAGTVWSHSIGAGGIVTFGSTNAGTPMVINPANVLEALAYLRTNLTQAGATVAFGYDVNSDGVINGNTEPLVVYQNADGWDIVALLAGTGVGTSTLGTVSGQNVVQLWDHTAPEIEGASFAANTLTLNYSENIHAVAGTPGSILLNGANGNIALSAAVTGGNVLNITTSGAALLQTDWLLMTTGSDFADASGNAAIAGQIVAFGGSGDNVITVTPAMNVSMIMGNAGNDTITATAAAEQIEGGIGADTIYSGGGADTFNFVQGDSTAVTFADVNLNGLVDNGDTFTFFGGVADIINGAVAGSTISLDILSDTSMSMSWAALSNTGQVGNQQYDAVIGNYAAGVFTVNNVGATAVLGIYDGDPTAGVLQTALVLSGNHILNPIGSQITIVV